VPRFLLGLTLVVATLAQTVVLPELTLLQVRPNLVVVLILLWTIARGPREGAWWAFGTGLFLDLVTLGPLGAHAVALLGVVVAALPARTPRFRLGLVLPMLAALGATVVHDALLLLTEGARATLLPSLLQLSLLTGLLNLAIVPLVSLLIDRLQRWQLDLEETLGRPPPPRRSGRPTRR
jgi:rod shape-determining protein MreD